MLHGHVAGRHVRVPTNHLQGGVAQQSLQSQQVAAVEEIVRCKGVSKQVRVKAPDT